MSGLASLGRIVGLALITTLITSGLGTVAAAHSAPAAAARTASVGPTAVAVSSSGTAYAGFATGGQLDRLGPKGNRLAPVPLDQDGPVDGLAMTPGGDIWVDYGTSASLLTPRGRVLRHLDHGPAGDCTGSSAARYGGIAVGGGRVWIAQRCDDSMTVHSPGGRLLATVDLPGGGHPRGITYGRAPSGRRALVYVALPDAGRVVVYRADRIGSSARPWRSVRLPSPGTGIRPRPTGVAVDRFGQLAVTDAANHALYLLDTTHDFARYRTLGHPPRAGRAAGRLRSPGALAQHAQDGGPLSGNLFVADTGNGRLQRWDTGGYTYWAKRVRPGRGSGPRPVGGPVSAAPPTIARTATVGDTLVCDPGAWASDGPGAGSIRLTYAWRRAGTPIAGATSAAYTVVDLDAGSALTCAVTASDGHGRTTRTSEPVVVRAPA